MADWDSSKTKERLDRDISNLVSYEVDKLNDKFSGINREIEQLKAMPTKIAIGIATLFGSAIITVGYSLIADHIAIKGMENEHKALVGKLEHGTSRLYPDFIKLKGVVEANMERSRGNTQWQKDWVKNGELKGDVRQDLLIRELDRRLKKLEK